MQIEFDGDWKVLLVIGGLGLIVFFVISTIFGLVAGLLVAILKGIWLLLKFLFSSIAGFAVLVAGAYFGYRGYKKIKEGTREEAETIEYTDEDFER
ncbi:phage holin family protein [Candidatus Bipolaricaulota bacterium]|nr:phage holin family protein [Candidatus Bipolaricaulota bacterium]